MPSSVLFVLIFITPVYYPLYVNITVSNLYTLASQLSGIFLFFDSIFFEHDEYYTPIDTLTTRENGGIALLKGHMAVKLDVHKKRVYLDDGTEIGYDKCLIATGRKSKISSPDLREDQSG